MSLCSFSTYVPFLDPKSKVILRDLIKCTQQTVGLAVSRICPLRVLSLVLSQKNTEVEFCITSYVEVFVTVRNEMPLLVFKRELDRKLWEVISHTSACV